MSREKMVTRSVITTTMAVKCANTATETIEEVEVKVSGEFTNDETRSKAARKAIKDRKELVFMSARVVVVTETLYGMSVDDFIANAKVLPPRSKNESEEQ